MCCNKAAFLVDGRLYKILFDSRDTQSFIVHSVLEEVGLGPKYLLVILENSTSVGKSVIPNLIC